MIKLKILKSNTIKKKKNKKKSRIYYTECVAIVHCNTISADKKVFST